MKTENKIVLPIVLLMIAAAIMGCKTEPELCALGAHLGIGESCTGTDCTLEDYRTPAQIFTFPKEINRYGKASNYTTEQLRQTADNIVEGYNLVSPASVQSAAMSKIGKICVTKAQNNAYTWDGSIFGVHVNRSETNVRTLIGDISDSNLPVAYPVAGLTSAQPANTIRLAAGKDSDTEQLPVLAGALLCTRSVLFIKRKTAKKGSCYRSVEMVAATYSGLGVE